MSSLNAVPFKTHFRRLRNLTRARFRTSVLLIAVGFVLRPALAAPPVPPMPWDGLSTNRAAVQQLAPTNAASTKATNAVAPALARGRELAQAYCATCHTFPEPELLPKSTWLHHVMPSMALWMGLEPVDYEGQTDGAILQEAHVFPPAPMLSQEDWFAIWDYYRAAAPLEPASPPSRAPVRHDLKGFRVRKVNFHSGAPMTSLVKIEPSEKRLYVSDAFAGLFASLNATGGVVQSTRLGSGAVSLAPTPAGFYVTLIGRMFPSDAREGSVVFLPRNQPTLEPLPILRELRRPTDTVVADLNGDRRNDFVVCSYGNRLGRLAWFEDNGKGGYTEHVLLDRPGAVRTEVRDFNRDGLPDILVLMAQAREGLFLFLNFGPDGFKMEPLVEQPPTFGYAGFELADFNSDGTPDLLTVNGDAGDFATPPKGYHGLRLYMNDGLGHFRLAWFYPLRGAYKALARDFDRDGDLDITTISYYPDFDRAPEESFVYLENKGGLRFEAFTFPESTVGRWITMDAGDLDGDGDIDLALGSFVRGPTTVPVPASLRDQWRTNGASVLILENEVASPK